MPLICCLVAESPGAQSARGVTVAPGVLEAVARSCSPRVEPHGDAAVVFDADGLTRVVGPPARIAAEVHRLAAARGAPVRVALAGTFTAAWVLAHMRPGISLVAPGDEAAALGPLPMRALSTVPDLIWSGGAAPRRAPTRPRNFRAAPGPRVPGAEARASGSALAGLLATLDRWGLRTLGDIARLSRADLHARFGETGVRLHQAACGLDAAPLVPAAEQARFYERVQLEWPIEGLEPLSFVLARLCESLSLSLERADRGAIGLHARLRLVTGAAHERQLELPAPIRDARVLRTLILLDLESHPPDAGIDAVEVEAEIVPGRIVQGSLLLRARPSPEAASTLLARLRALMGETRVGAPVVLDSHDERMVAMGEFTIEDKGRRQRAERRSAERTDAGHSLLGLKPKDGWQTSAHSSLLPFALCPAPLLRRFRDPVPARVAVDRGVPAALWPGARHCSGGRVRVASGPWRTSGRWWTPDRTRWDRDEWDVALVDGSLYRIARDRASGAWSIDGTID
jgi:protein ImuB